MSGNSETLPNILEVLEDLSKMEIDESVKRPEINFLRMDVGTFNVVSRGDERELPFLFPNSTSPMTFYRGQNKFWEKCVPNLYRERVDSIPFEDYKLINQIKKAEFFRIILSHPVVVDFLNNFYIDLTALAQHYGFPTDYLDITNDKWVAAFFACTKYVNNHYIPIGKDFEDGVGVIYVSYPNSYMSYVPPQEGLFSRLNVIGFQYFERPSKQSSFFYKLDEGEDFNNAKWFYKIKFRHDINASKIVHKMSYKQRRYYPNDYTSVVANTIMDKSYEVSWESVMYAKILLGVSQSDKDIKQILLRNNIPWHTSVETKIKYDVGLMHKEWNEWDTYGMADLLRKINPIIPFAEYKQKKQITLQHIS